MRRGDRTYAETQVNNHYKAVIEEKSLLQFSLMEDDWKRFVKTMVGEVVIPGSNFRIQVGLEMEDFY